MLDSNTLDFWIKNQLNVIITGRHGVGKTAIILDAFERNFKNFKYFSGSTMDPWTDFVGIPVPKEVSDQNAHVIEYALPPGFHDDTVEAIFIDEFNRSHKKVRNGVMELIQFKSINGRKFNNLKVIWAAVNPDDEGGYDVEPIDPAQQDRFQIHVTLPYACDPVYFKRSHGKYGEAAVKWWGALDEKARLTVSPRRLDYALSYYAQNGDLRHVLSDVHVNVTTLSQLLAGIKNKETITSIRSIFEKRDKQSLIDNLKSDIFLGEITKEMIALGKVDFRKKIDCDYRHWVLRNMPKEYTFSILQKEELMQAEFPNNFVFLLNCIVSEKYAEEYWYNLTSEYLQTLSTARDKGIARKYIGEGWVTASNMDTAHPLYPAAITWLHNIRNIALEVEI